jgi:hypothetical protein
VPLDFYCLMIYSSVAQGKAFSYIFLFGCMIILMYLIVSVRHFLCTYLVLFLVAD